MGNTAPGHRDRTCIAEIQISHHNSRATLLPGAHLALECSVTPTFFKGFLMVEKWSLKPLGVSLAIAQGWAQRMMLSTTRNRGPAGLSKLQRQEEPQEELGVSFSARIRWGPFSMTRIKKRIAG